MKLHEITKSINVGIKIPRRLYKKKFKKYGFIYMNENYIKFHYTNYKHDKIPKVKVLDYDYLGRLGQKSYGTRKDILGYNINYVSNKKAAIKAIDDISNFADMLSNNNEEKYRRIKYFFPKQSEFIRRYMKKHIKGLKYKKGFLWKKTNINDLKKMEKI